MNKKHVLKLPMSLFTKANKWASHCYIWSTSGLIDNTSGIHKGHEVKNPWPKVGYNVLCNEEKNISA